MWLQETFVSRPSPPVRFVIPQISSFQPFDPDRTICISVPINVKLRTSQQPGHDGDYRSTDYRSCHQRTYIYSIGDEGITKHSDVRSTQHSPSLRIYLPTVVCLYMADFNDDRASSCRENANKPCAGYGMNWRLSAPRRFQLGRVSTRRTPCIKQAIWA